MSESSSDEDNLDKLREAADIDFINDNMFNKTEQCKAKEFLRKSDQSKLPSLRPVKDDQEQFNLLDVTPEFQNHVAKHLSNILETQLEKKFTSDIQYPTKVKCKSSIKLFRDSKHFISLKNKSAIDENRKRCAVKRRTIENDELEEDLKVKSCAVDPVEVLNKKDTQFWTERNRGEVFNYKRDGDGQLVSIEKVFK